MDPNLLKEREAFRKRALQNPVVEKKKESSNEPAKKKAKTNASQKQTKSSSSDFSFRPVGSGQSQYFFSLTKIVKHMRQRHLEGDTHALSLEDILDETHQMDISNRQKQFLLQALANNPKVEMMPDGKYVFKPTYPIRDRRGLLRLLDKHDQRGLGGILYEHVQESLPNVDKALKILGDSVIQVVQPQSKKKVLFYNDKDLSLNVDEEFQKLWRSIAVEGIDDGKIEEYLKKQGIHSMQDVGVKKITPVHKRKKPSNKNRNFKKLNQHLGDILKDYSDT